MLIKRLSDCREITARDGTRLRELLHPERDPVETGYSLAVARLEPGKVSLPHRLRQSEVYYVIRGTGRMHVGDEAAAVGPGDAVYIPAGSAQWLENTGDEPLEFACIVDPAWRAEDETVLRNEPPRAPRVRRRSGVHHKDTKIQRAMNGRKPGKNQARSADQA